MNPLEKIFKDIDDLEQLIKNKSADFMFGCLGKDAQARAVIEIQALKDKQAAMELKKQRAMDFYKRSADIVSGKQSVVVPRFKDKIKGNYFRTYLQPHMYQFSPPDAVCDICGRAETSRTAIMFTVDPLSSEFIDVCEYCYIERNHKK